MTRSSPPSDRLAPGSRADDRPPIVGARFERDPRDAERRIQPGVRVDPAGIVRGSPGSLSVTSPNTETPAPKVQSPSTFSRWADLSEGAPSANRFSNPVIVL